MLAGWLGPELGIKVGDVRFGLSGGDALELGVGCSVAEGTRCRRLSGITPLGVSAMYECGRWALLRT